MENRSVLIRFSECFTLQRFLLLIPQALSQGTLRSVKRMVTCCGLALRSDRRVVEYEIRERIKVIETGSNATFRFLNQDVISEHALLSYYVSMLLKVYSKICCEALL